MAATIGVATAPAVVLLVAASSRRMARNRRSLWHVALNNIVAMLGIALLLPFVEARVSGTPWNPSRALWLVAGSFLLGYRRSAGGAVRPLHRPDQGPDSSLPSA